MSKLITHLNTILNTKRKVLKYSKGTYTEKNIGDALNIFLFQKVFKKEVISYKEVFNLGVPPVYSFIGSVLDNSAVRNLTVLGSGFKSEDSKLPVNPKRVIACRGPLTRKKLLDSGIKNIEKVYGDPAILLPLYYKVNVDKKFRMGIIPHYTDKNLPIVKEWIKKEGVKFIDVFSDMETFVREIKSCDFTISSSLHGVILSHAYGIPSGWVKLSDALVGGGFKFKDYFLSVGKSFEPLALEPSSKISELEAKSILPEMDPITTKLERTFSNFEFN